MCGIAGIVSWNDARKIPPSRIHHMCQTMLHRGPDDEGVYTHAGVGLGMRRLSIIDVDGGHQPIHNEEETVWIVFNGEIYNFPELRRELQARGHRFYTNTDTEAVIHLYEDYGSECVLKLRGMFAFAIYDMRHRSLLLARDRLGIKPLHYGWEDGSLVFSSEIKAILSVAPELGEINQAALREFFHWGYIPDAHTAFGKIRKLPPGHVLELSEASPELKVRQYWNLPSFGTNSIGSEEECLSEIDARLTEAVRCHMRSDVPLGVLLSGGTDSSIIVALTARASSKPIKTFSVGFTNSDFDETQYSRLVARQFGTEHNELIVKPNVEEALDRITGSLEEPFGDSSVLPTYFISRVASNHVKVALSGDGGDELFAGYDRYLTHVQRGKFNAIPSWAGRLFRKSIFPRLPIGMRGRKYAYNATLSWDERYLDSISFISGVDHYSRVLSLDFQRNGRADNDLLNLFRARLRQASAVDDLSRILYLDTKTYLVDDILTKVDRMSMASSLEVRVPILDHLFVEWVTGLPITWKLRGNKRKFIFAKLAERLGIPADIVHRPKQGFALPLVHWMRNELREEIARILLEPKTLQRGYFNRQGVEKLLGEHFQGRRDQSATLWLLLIFELWHRNFLERVSRSPSGTTVNSAA